MLLLGACWRDGSSECREWRQGTAGYKFVIISPTVAPAVEDSVAYRLSVLNRSTGQPVEDGEGHLFARAGETVTANLMKAPQVGQYLATIRFPRAAEWSVTLRFRERTAKAFEETQWLQSVGSTSPSRTMLGVKPPWLWRTSTPR